MPTKLMIIEDAHPSRPGFVERYYAQIEVSIPKGSSTWVWIQKDDKGVYVGTATPGFYTEDDAFDDALQKMGGTEYV